MAGQLKATRQILHDGEIEAQRQFGTEGFDWNDDKLEAMFRQTISPERIQFLESQYFFFIATANAQGECDCSFRGRECDATGKPYPLVKVLDEMTLVFPDYTGNRLYNSLGNIIVNGHIGMLFIDFQDQKRMRINGIASIIDDQTAYASVWPNAERYVMVSTQQVFGNCKARIPSMMFIRQGVSG